ncbi:hypothetical protein ARMGADRAFT_1034423 [Armillaria gallica]|uniref:Uncharacterized protein n=1 Tax=Armillaria gallica TaxID=47427 RepID=A0A2H3DK31_ARMGA|nr:hypothetical protein ARMGADRAFT_1034423 [Armillaria gallica]
MGAYILFVLAYHSLGPFAARGFITIVIAYHLVDSGVQYCPKHGSGRDSVRLYHGEDGEATQTVSLLESVRSLAPRLLLGIGERDIRRLHPAMKKFGEFSRGGSRVVRRILVWPNWQMGLHRMIIMDTDVRYFFPRIRKIPFMTKAVEEGLA